MQRALLGAGRLAVAPVAVGTAVHRAQQPSNQPREPTSPTLAAEEHDDWVDVLEAPVQRAEVSAALGELSAAGGGPALTRAANRLPLPAPGRPLIEELGANCTESDASSEGSAANHLMASVDTLHPWFDSATAAGGALVEEDSTFDLLATTITNVLNDERVVDTIQRRLLEDPAFAALLSRMGSPAAMPLLLEELSGDGLERGDGRGPGATGNPLVDLLQAIQGGIGVAAVQLGTAFLHLGHFLRGVGEHMSRALAGLDGGRRSDGGEAPQPLGAAATGLIIAKVAAAVGVLVLTRRVALARMVVV